MKLSRLAQKRTNTTVLYIYKHRFTTNNKISLHAHRHTPIDSVHSIRLSERKKQVHNAGTQVRERARAHTHRATGSTRHDSTNSSFRHHHEVEECGTRTANDLYARTRNRAPPPSLPRAVQQNLYARTSHVNT